MSMKRFAIVTSCLAGATLAVSLFFIDWYALGNAIPPGSPDLSTGLATLDGLRLNEVSAAGTAIEVSPNSEIRFTGKLKTKVGQWRWSALAGSRSLKDVLRKAKRTADLPRLELSVLLLSKSLFPPGYAIDASSLARLSPAPPDLVKFDGVMGSPTRGGEYELRLVVTPRPMDRFAPEPEVQYVVGSFRVRVDDLDP